MQLNNCFKLWRWQEASTSQTLYCCASNPFLMSRHWKEISHETFCLNWIVTFSSHKKHSKQQFPRWQRYLLFQALLICVNCCSQAISFHWLFHRRIWWCQVCLLSLSHASFSTQSSPPFHLHSQFIRSSPKIHSRFIPSPTHSQFLHPKIHPKFTSNSLHFHSNSQKLHLPQQGWKKTTIFLSWLKFNLCFSFLIHSLFTRKILCFSFFFLCLPISLHSLSLSFSCAVFLSSCRFHQCVSLSFCLFVHIQLNKRFHCLFLFKSIRCLSLFNHCLSFSFSVLLLALLSSSPVCQMSQWMWSENKVKIMWK